MMDFVPLIWLALGLSLAMTAAWAVQRLTGASGWVDTIWSLAVGAGGLAAAWAADGAIERRWLAAALVGLWSLRLAGHIGLRTRGAGEDPRYEKLIKEWGPQASLRLFLFLQVQALCAFVLVAAVYIVASGAAPFPQVTDFLGGALSVLALAGEALSDHQLQQFRKTPEAKTGVMERGLWAWSRHPNYFFEWLFWCGWFVIALGQPGWWIWLTALAPMQMYWLLVHVSGIPPLEEHMLKTRGDAFRALQSRVNAFFPGPRNEAASPIGDTKESRP
jgi:steroid 5-alpha reductase family enzyme